jgi:hypothetical protein
MPYTVTYRDAGIKRHEFDAYVRLLEKRGVDLTNIPRVHEPGTTNRWLYVWAERTDAEHFRDELRHETHDLNWLVHELPDTVQPSHGPLTPLVVIMRRHSLGADFTLHPHSRALLQRRFPQARAVSSVSIETSALHDFEQQHGPIWEQIVQVLTGLTPPQLAQLGGYRIVDPIHDQTVFEDNLVNAES